MDEQARWRVSPASAVAELPLPSAPNPWRTIWFSPRQTFRQLFKASASRSWIAVYSIAMLGTFLDSVNTSWGKGQLSAASWLTVIPLYVAGSWVTLWGAAWLLALYGRWRGGRGSAAQLRVALGWSCVPTALTVACWGPIWILNGGPMPDEPTPESLRQVIATVLYVYTFVAALWVMILWVPAVAEAHRFSLWKAIDSLVCVAFISFITLLGGVLLVLRTLQSARAD